MSHTSFWGLITVKHSEKIMETLFRQIKFCHNVDKSNFVRHIFLQPSRVARIFFDFMKISLILNIIPNFRVI